MNTFLTFSHNIKIIFGRGQSENRFHDLHVVLSVSLCVCVCVCVCAQVLFMSASIPLQACMFSSPEFQWRHLQGRKEIRFLLAKSACMSVFPLICLYVYLSLVPSVCLFGRVYIFWSDPSPLCPSIHLSACCSVSLFAWLVGWQLCQWIPE